jgi:hypothetical protein
VRVHGIYAAIASSCVLDDCRGYFRHEEDRVAAIASRRIPFELTEIARKENAIQTPVRLKGRRRDIPDKSKQASTECRMQMERDRRSAALARGLMRTVSSPVTEAATSAQAETADGKSRQVVVSDSVKSAVCTLHEE